jgi:hypothetical protein
MEKMLLKLLENNPKAKALLEKLTYLKHIFPPFKTQIITDNEQNEYFALLFDHTPENRRRVEAIGELLGEILSPFDVYQDFNLATDNTTYAALMFPIKNTEEKTNGQPTH